jgi:hypothetical protein
MSSSEGRQERDWKQNPDPKTHANMAPIRNVRMAAEIISSPETNLPFSFLKNREQIQ